MARRWPPHTPTTCFCRCHCDGDGCIGAGRANVIHAALACPACRDLHCPALTTRTKRPDDDPPLTAA